MSEENFIFLSVFLLLAPQFSGWLVVEQTNYVVAFNTHTKRFFAHKIRLKWYICYFSLENKKEERNRGLVSVELYLLI